MELSKDKASMKQVEMHTNQFLKTLNHVEGELSKHINYLTQVSTGIHEINSFFTLFLHYINFIFLGQPHEGSAYGSSKMYKMAKLRMDHTRTRLQELDNLKTRVRSTDPSSNRPASSQNNP